MTRLLFAAAAAALIAAPAIAKEPTARSFVRDGVTYSYTSFEKDGARVLEGTANGAPFTFEVRGTQVIGTADGQPVAFTIKANTITLASR